MSVEETNRLSIMRQIDKKMLTLKKASEELGVSERQVKRIHKRYLKEGNAQSYAPKKSKTHLQYSSSSL